MFFFCSFIISIFSLLDVVQSSNSLYLVFEFLNQDLKKYLDSLPASGMQIPLVKVSSNNFSLSSNSLSTFMQMHMQYAMYIKLTLILV